MKKYLMVFLAVILFSTAASAQTQGYIGLFADATHTSWCGSAASIPGNFMMYIFALPRADGTFCFEFMLDYPTEATIIATGESWDAAMPVVMGNLASGVSACYAECRTGWQMICTQLIITTAATQGVISVVPHPSAGGPNMNECLGIRPIYPAVAFTNLYVNYTDGVDPECSETGTADVTWGAIKNMYAD
jgi:hypothetical protein